MMRPFRISAPLRAVFVLLAALALCGAARAQETPDALVKRVS